MYRHKVNAYLNTLDCSDMETFSPSSLRDGQPSRSAVGTLPFLRMPTCAEMAPCLKILAKIEQNKAPERSSEPPVIQVNQKPCVGQRLLDIIESQRATMSAFKYISGVLQQLQSDAENSLRKSQKQKVRRYLRPVGPETPSSSAFEEVSSTVNSTDSQPLDASHVFSDVVSQSPLVQYPQRVDGIVPMVVLGPNGTQIAAMFFDELDWSSPVSPTRTLLSAVFHTDILATHTLTGKPSPAFKGRARPRKLALDPKKTSDIIYCVRKLTGISEREIRNIITTKCSDAAKKLRRDSGSSNSISI